ncbi:MAG: hypothetical protein EXS13_01615 [Planctomycetes bacterium]|nr:hypothetical protein [Planctomycetota bacterium]
MRVSIAAAFVLLVPACNGLHSTEVSAETAHAGKAPEGISYFLPMRHVKLTAVRAKVSLTEMRGRLAKAVATSKEGDATRDAAKVALQEAENNLKVAPENPDLKKARDEATGRFGAREAISWRRRRPAGSGAKPPHSSASGLLQSANFTRTGQTGAILMALVDTYMTLRVGIGSGRESFLLPAEPPSPPIKPFQFEAIFDPTDASQINAINASVASHASNLRLDVVADWKAPAPRPDSKEPLQETFADPIYPADADGIVYRRPLPYTIRVLTPTPDPAGDDKTKLMPTVKAVQVELPNRSPATILPYKTGLFTKTTQEVGFVDGTLVKVSSSRPSEVLGFIKILPDMAKEIVSIPAEILQLKIDTTQTEAELIEAQRALEEARKPVPVPPVDDTGDGG